MKKHARLCRMVVGVAALLGASVGRSQSIYADEWGDENDDIYTSLTGYWSSSSCAGLSMSSYLNGSWGSASYPGQFEILVQNQILSAPSGVDYPWTWSWSYQFPDPYSGACDTTGQTNYSSVGIHHTFYGPPPAIGPITCTYTNLACTSGMQVCTGGIAPQFYSGCPNYVGITYLKGGSSCYGLFFVDATSGMGGHCD